MAEAGVDVAEPLANAGLEKGLFANSEQLLSYRAAGRLIQQCILATGYEDFGLRVGMRQSAAILGLAGYVGTNAPSVRQALETMIGSLKLSDTGGSASLVLERGYAALRWIVVEPDIPAVNQIDDIAIAVIFNILSELCGSQWRAAEVRLTRERPKNTALFVQFFNAPVRFETDVACVIFEEAWLDHEVQGRDPQLHDILSPLLAQALEENGASFKEKVCDILRTQLLNGPLTPDRTAATLGISVRTLSRRLADEDATFSELAQAIRFEIAQRMLRAGKSLSDIAGALGYSDPTAFIRAFKQFAGMTPARWRRSL
ncbi:AraC family transcriptional regulator [Methylocystis parvus]|uniref:AraC family transcriptional regulator n=1 Tax=Methylocystis parvus TaxID=134 RepID=UPI0002F99C33|nr:AraC family transcriptional regulator [Methylocystis parvus]